MTAFNRAIWLTWGTDVNLDTDSTRVVTVVDFRETQDSIDVREDIVTPSSHLLIVR